jgi:hypothetical protein
MQYMSYRLALLGDLPLAYWRLNDTSGTTSLDLSGNGYTLTHNGSPALNQGPITAGGSSITYSGTQNSTATIPRLFFPQREGFSLAMEVFVDVLTIPTDTRLLIGRANAGLFVTPNGIEFRITNSVGTTYSSIYPITDWDAVKHVVGIYGNGKFTTTVNLVPAPSATLAGTFAAGSTTFYVGGSSTTSATQMKVSDAAVYNLALAPDDMVDHYDAANSALFPKDVAISTKGNFYGLDDTNATAYITYEEKGTAALFKGVLSNVVAQDDKLTLFAAGTGTKNVIPIDLDGLASTIAGSRIDWEASASGVLVETSLDGSAWSTATNHSTITGLVSGTNTANKLLYVRITLTSADLIATPVVFNRLKIVVYSSKNVAATRSNVPAIITSPDNATLAELPYRPIDSRQKAGGRLARPAYLTIPAQPDSVLALGFWYKRDTAYSNGGTFWEYIFDARLTTSGPYMGITPGSTIGSGGGTFYINGVSKTPAIGDFPLGAWVHVFVVPTVPLTAAIEFNANYTLNEIGNNSFDSITLYYVAPGASSISKYYNMMIGNRTFNFVDPNVNSMPEISYFPYNYYWGQQSS